ncbi:hypothetical protein TrLO_g13375 [Triparma laevis f. longispina]|uniref:Uncharacterized protein n=1 Tax=Triparma laevis f. longispina TaxID=1714387 RepID=A0A9W6ZZX8_9STRA|nr:hypothetical protein TrLO_g13375 [Triparma laevis f. longispina]
MTSRLIVGVGAAAAAVSAAVVYKAIFAGDKNLERARTLWAELMPVAAVSFSWMGGNSPNYQAKAATGETYMLKITAVDSSSELLATMLGASRVALDAALAPHKTRWLQICTRLVGEVGLGLKLLAANESAIVLEFVKGKVLGPAGSVDTWFQNNPEAHVRLGRFYAKLGKIDVFTDAEAAEIAPEALTNHPYNFKDPVQALLGLPEARCGWPNVKEVKQAVLRELQRSCHS